MHGTLTSGGRRTALPARRASGLVHAIAGFAALIGLAGAPRHAAADPNALWRIVHQQCIPNQERLHAPRPCELVDLSAGYVVLKDLVGATQFLVMPTVRIDGIESLAILQPDTPNYWQAAWEARRYVDERAHRILPRETISLAINSERGRTQNQLHIHVDCTRLDVIAALRQHAAAIGPTWSPFPVRLSGHHYMALRIDRPDLVGVNPFVLLADGISGARADMGDYTLVMVGMPEGFVLLADRATGITNRGSGEELQDHACAAAH